MGSSTCTRTMKANLGLCAPVKEWSVNAEVCMLQYSPTLVFLVQVVHVDPIGDYRAMSKNGSDFHCESLNVG